MVLFLQLRHQVFQDGRFTWDKHFIDRAIKCGREVLNRTDLHTVDGGFFLSVFITFNTGEDYFIRIRDKVQSRIFFYRLVNRTDGFLWDNLIINNCIVRTAGDSRTVKGEHESTVFF